jgi:hypothetical protein
MIEAQPYKGGKKGADTGIDGFLYFKPDGKTTEKAIVEVKGGENVSPQWVRALGQVVERERAKIGVLVTLADPTVTMRREAAAAGLYKTEYGSFAKLQILTVEDLFNGQRPRTCPGSTRACSSAPSARRRKSRASSRCERRCGRAGSIGCCKRASGQAGAQPLFRCERGDPGSASTGVRFADAGSATSRSRACAGLRGLLGALAHCSQARLVLLGKAARAGAARLVQKGGGKRRSLRSRRGEPGFEAGK